MIDLVSFAFVIPELFAWIVEHWEIVVTLCVIAGGGAGFVVWYRITEKQQIHKTHVENIDALESLIKARDREIVELKATGATCAAALESLRSEYKIVSGIVLADLISFESNRIGHFAKLAVMSSELQIKDQQIIMLEKKLAET